MITRDEARKRYSLLNNVFYALKEIKIVGYRYYGFLFMDIAAQILVPFLFVLIPAEVVRMLQGRLEIQTVLLRVVYWILVILLINLGKTYAHQKIETMSNILADSQYWRKLNRKMLSCSLTEIENHKERDILTEVMQALYPGDGMGNYSGVKGFYMYGISFAANVGGFLLYALIASNLHILLFVILFITSIINCYAKIKAIQYQFKNMETFWENSDRFWYMKNESINTEKAKDVRMYHLSRWFKSSLHANTTEASKIYSWVMQYHLYANSMASFTSLIRDGFAYIFLIIQLMNGTMNITSFIIYIGIVAGFGMWVTQVVESYTYLNKINFGISLYRVFIGKQKDDDEADIDIPSHCHTIVFDDVSFGYDDHLIFDHFSLTLHEGEKIALVGSNGAGKTTLTKLLCGFYPLQAGRILVDGVDIATLDRDQYYCYFSVLFQDVHVLPFSIAKNISCAWTDEEEQEMKAWDKKQEIVHAFAYVDDGKVHRNAYDEERVIQCLKKVNLWDKVCTLPKGIHTTLMKILDSNGVLLSGGETQRLMLARALYKNAPILILDEPTAALDPIAESELYNEYAQLCIDKISIFISHRLSSTRFCDRILFLENGVIQEEGSHDELMQKDEKYARMYQIQSHYYQREVCKHDADI